MAKIKAATISVSLEAESAKFSAVLDRAQKQAANSTNGIIRSLAGLENKSKAFSNNMEKYLNKPFKAFDKATAPFRIAARQIKSIVTNLITPFKNFIKRAAKPFTSAFKKMSSAMKSFGGVAKTLGGIAGIAAAGIVGITVASVKSSREIELMSKKLGISYAELNKLTGITAQYGITAEETSDAVKDLTVKIEDAAQGGGPLVDFFEQNNISAREWSKLNPAQQFEKFVSVINTLPESEARFWLDEINDGMFQMTAIASLSKDEMAALGKEMEGLGSSVSVENFQPMFQVMSKVATTVRNVFTGVAAQLAPIVTNALTSAMNKFKSLLDSDYGGFNATGFQNFVNDMAVKVIDGVIGIFSAVDLAINSIKSAFDSVVSFINGIATSGVLQKLGITEGGRASLTASAKSSMSDYDRKNLDGQETAYKSALRAERQLKENKDALKKLEDSAGFIKSKEEERDIERAKSRVRASEYSLLNLANEQGISGTRANGTNISDELLRRYNQQIITANEKAFEKEAPVTSESSTVGFLKELRTDILSRTTVTPDITASKNSLLESSPIQTGDIIIKVDGSGNEVVSESGNVGADTESLSDKLQKKKDALQQEVDATQESNDRKAELDERYAERRRFLYDDMLNNSLDFFSKVEGATNSHTQAIIGVKNQEIINAKDAEENRLGIVLSSGSKLLAEGAKHNKKMFKMNKALNIAQASMSMFTGMAEALKWGFPMGPVFAGIIAASGAMNIANIASQEFTGQAHDGIDYVTNGGKNEGTWLLETGERVVDKRTNADLKSFLQGSGRASTSNSNTTTVDAPVNVTTTASSDDVLRILREYPEELGSIIRRTQQGGFM